MYYNLSNFIRIPNFYLSLFIFILSFLSIEAKSMVTILQGPPKILRHVVMFKFKESSTAADVKKVEEAFVTLPKKIKSIKSIEFGTNNSPENLNQGFTHCFILTFKSEKDRDDYLPHPDHKAFGKVLGPHLDKVMVLDYWAK